jgi:hypothetical protein
MALNSRSIEEILGYLRQREYFTAEELFQRYRLYEPSLNYSTFKSRLRELKNKNLIRDVMRGIYTVSDKPFFKPEISKNLKRITKLFNTKYPDILYCAWSTSWMNNFTIHQIMSSFNILEVEKDVVDSIFHNFQENGLSVFIQPDKESIDRYVLAKDGSLIIIPLITRAPTLILDDTAVPSLEKILVDIFCDQDLYYIYSGNELMNIYRYAHKKYTLNYSRLLTYAERRKKKNEIREYIINNVDNSLRNLL